jgi:hypothetical protein
MPAGIFAGKMKDLLCTCIESALDELLPPCSTQRVLNGIHFEHAPSILAMVKAPILWLRFAAGSLEGVFVPKAFC